LQRKSASVLMYISMFSVGNNAEAGIVISLLLLNFGAWHGGHICA